MIVAPDLYLAIVDKEGRQVQELNEFFVGLESLDKLNGLGSPEGVVEATQGRLYWDRVGIAGAILYIKRDADIAGDKTKGWILV
jgi:hypothetical protein